MSVREYFDQNKQKLFPAIKDWTDPQDDIRNSNNVKDMNWGDWFWCHPSAYSLIQIGGPAGMMFTGLLAGVLSYMGGWMTAVFFSGVIFAVGSYVLFRKIKTYETFKNTTFYDMHLREYRVGKVK